MSVLCVEVREDHRVALLVTRGDCTQQPLDPRRRYDLNVVLAQCRVDHDDPYVWLQRRLLPASATTDSNAIIAVSIRTWPA
jgi:hypothetical protein